MIHCNRCNGVSPDDAIYCIECAKLLVENTTDTIRLTSSMVAKKDFFIYKADLGALLQDVTTYVEATQRGYNIYYHGRKIVFMD